MDAGQALRVADVVRLECEPSLSSFPTATLSSGVQGGNELSSSAVYSAGSGCG